MQTKTIAHMEFQLPPFDGETAYVHIYIDGVYYDTREFFDFAHAEKFFADPLAADRKSSQPKPQAVDTRYLDSVAIRDIYRRTA